MLPEMALSLVYLVHYGYYAELVYWTLRWDYENYCYPLSAVVAAVIVSPEIINELRHESCYWEYWAAMKCIVIQQLKD